MPRADWAPWLLGVCGAAAVAWSLGPSRPQRVVSSPCEAVALVDGLLVCADAKTFEDSCGTLHSMRAGDSLEGCQLGRMSAEDLEALEISVDPNRAGVAELQSLPGIGPVLAERIRQGRPYLDAQSLLRVSGVGPRTLERIRPRLSLPNRRP